MLTPSNTWDLSPNLKIGNTSGGLTSRKLSGCFDPDATNATYQNCDNFLWAFSQIFEMNSMTTQAWFTAKTQMLDTYY